MTWWGALGLALSLYGIVVLLEWAYDRIMGTYRENAPAVSVVVRAANQEYRIEHIVRELIGLFNQREWSRRKFEVVFTDDGSNDRTHDMLDLLSRQHPFFTVADRNIPVQDLMTSCRYPLVVWVDLARQPQPDRLIATLNHLLQ